MTTRAAQQHSATALHGDSWVDLRRGMPAPSGIALALDNRMDARNVRGQPEDGEAASPRGARGGGTFGAKSKSLHRVAQTTFWPGLRAQTALEAATQMTRRVLSSSFADRSASNLRFSMRCMLHEDGLRGPKPLPGSRGGRIPAFDVARATEATATLVCRGCCQ